MQAKFGPILDISKFLPFHWWEPVYYLDLEGVEHHGHWAGIVEHIGDELTWWIVSAETGKAVPRSDVRMATDPSHPNLHADAALFKGELGEMKSQDLEDDVDPFLPLLAPSALASP